MEPSIPIPKLVKLDNSEEIRNEKIPTLDSPLENNNVTSKLESQNLSTEIHDASPEILLTQTTHPSNKSKPQFWKYRKYCHKWNQSFSNCLRKQREDGEKYRNFFLDRYLLPNPLIKTLEPTKIKFILMINLHLIL